VDEGSAIYKQAASAMTDTKFAAAETDNAVTYQDFGRLKASPPESVIDFIFVSEGDFAVSSYKVIDEKFDGKFTSDHYAILSELHFK
jgi:endonuclease/exonuclease/phosphatase family metal-dependent hydrolase